MLVCLTLSDSKNEPRLCVYVGGTGALKHRRTTNMDVDGWKDIMCPPTWTLHGQSKIAVSNSCMSRLVGTNCPTLSLPAQDHKLPRDFMWLQLSWCQGTTNMATSPLKLTPSMDLLCLVEKIWQGNLSSPQQCMMEDGVEAPSTPPSGKKGADSAATPPTRRCRSKTPSSLAPWTKWPLTWTSGLIRKMTKVCQPTQSGISYLRNGQPFISGWPTNRKPIFLKHELTQTVEEAAEWCSKARKSWTCGNNNTWMCITNFEIIY